MFTAAHNATYNHDAGLACDALAVKDELVGIDAIPNEACE
jgi:hypothetical protein